MDSNSPTSPRSMGGEDLQRRWRPLLETVGFSARAHRNQLRKDGRTPYSAHPMRVCLIVSQVFGITDLEVLQTALLHDTIEDTTTDFDDLAEQFGTAVATAVGALSKDTRLPDDPREEAYCRTLTHGGPAVQICKLADMFDNLMDSESLPPEKQRRTVARSRKYLSAIDETADPRTRPAVELVRSLIDHVASRCGGQS